MNVARLAISLTAILIGVGPALAQEGPTDGEPIVDHVPVDSSGPVFLPPTGSGGGEGARVSGGTESRPVAAGGVVAASGGSVGAAAAQALEDATVFCAAVPAEYAVDCLAERLEAVARTLPTSGPLAETRQVLSDTSSKLASLARSNADPAKPRQTFAAPSMPRPVATTRPLTPVAPAAQAEVNAAAVAILDQAETLLLRSSATEVASAAAPEIERIAAAIGSNKVLLRSA
jgi:hypothetical protein